MNTARAQLIEIALNRKYPQAKPWLLSERRDGAVNARAGAIHRVINQAAWEKPSVLDVFDHIEKYCNLPKAIG